MQDNHHPHDPHVTDVPVSELLHRAAARVDACLDQRFAAAGLTSRQYVLLKSIGRHEGINQMGLTALTGIDRSTMTDMIGRLVSRGYVQRERSTTDGRAYRVRLSDTGQQQLARVMPAAHEVNAALDALIDPGLHDELAGLLKKIAEWPG